MANSLVKGSGCGTREWREDFKLEDASGGSILKVPQAGTGEIVLNDASNDLDLRVESNGSANAIFVDAGNDRVGIFTAAPTVALDVTGAAKISSTLEVTGAITATGGIARTGVKRLFTANAKAGAGAGWTVNAGNDLGTLATMAASQTAGTLVCRLDGLKVGDTITAFHLIGQIESAGNVVTLDADLRALTAAAGDPTDASIAAMTQLSVTADTAVTVANTAKTAIAEVVAADKVYYMLITGTTNASTDVQLLGVAVTVTEA